MFDIRNSIYNTYEYSETQSRVTDFINVTQWTDFEFILITDLQKSQSAVTIPRMHSMEGDIGVEGL
jgi:hypothetical protein